MAFAAGDNSPNESTRAGSPLHSVADLIKAAQASPGKPVIVGERTPST